MADKIHVDSSVTASSINVGGACYNSVGPSSNNATVTASAVTTAGSCDKCKKGPLGDPCAPTTTDWPAILVARGTTEGGDGGSLVGVARTWTANLKRYDLLYPSDYDYDTGAPIYGPPQPYWILDPDGGGIVVDGGAAWFTFDSVTVNYCSHFGECTPYGWHYFDAGDFTGTGPNCKYYMTLGSGAYLQHCFKQDGGSGPSGSYDCKQSATGTYYDPYTTSVSID